LESSIESVGLNSVSTAGFKVASGIHEQPVGYDETLLGAYKRQWNLYTEAQGSVATFSSESVFLISIESGMFNRGNIEPTHNAPVGWEHSHQTPVPANVEWTTEDDQKDWWDIAIIVITEFRKGQIRKEELHWTDKTAIPQEYLSFLRTSIQTHHQDVTFGSLVETSKAQEWTHHAKWPTKAISWHDYIPIITPAGKEAAEGIQSLTEIGQRQILLAKTLESALKGW